MPLIPPSALQRLRTALRGQDTVAFVFSGGSNLGAVQVGMLRALFEHDIHPDVIVGCSVGAVNGAAYAQAPGLRGLNRLANIWGRLEDGQPDLMPNRLLPLALQMARKGASIYDPTVLLDLLQDEIRARDFDELEVPFACVATNVDDAKEHWFDQGPLLPALMASAALPSVFPPVEIGGELFMDGGVVREAPVVQAAEMGANVIYLLHVGHLDEIREPNIDRPFDAALHAYWVARHRRFEEDLEELGKKCELIRLPSGSDPRLRYNDFSRSRRLARLSYEASSEFLSTGELSEPELVVSDDA